LGAAQGRVTQLLIERQAKRQAAQCPPRPGKGPLVLLARGGAGHAGLMEGNDLAQ